MLDSHLKELWLSRGISNEIISFICEILAINVQKGFDLNQECMLIVQAALHYLGLPYLRSEELDATGIDCSTLTSQSYWEGALIGIPFTSTKQRIAQSGVSINTDAVRPSDIVIKYSSPTLSEDKKFNHVGLVLGWDSEGTIWIIESNERFGCVISHLEDFSPEGGIRRFCFNYKYEFTKTQKILQLAPYVPKFGRFGVRQYLKNSLHRPIHHANDIYIPKDTVVYAPIAGLVQLTQLDYEESSALCIKNDSSGQMVVLGHVHISEGILNEFVRPGTSLGVVTNPSSSLVEYSHLFCEQTHVHFEYAENQKILRSPQSHCIINNGWVFKNGLYEAKIGNIVSPLTL